MEAHAPRQFGRDLREALSLTNGIEPRANLKGGNPLLRRRINIGGKERLRLLRGLHVAAIGPEHRRSVANLHPMPAVFLQIAVQNRRIGESRRFRDGGVVALLVAVGGKCIEIERYQTGARGLRAPDALDRRVQPRHRGWHAVHKADLRIGGALRADPAPQVRRGAPVMHEALKVVVSQRKDDILISRLLGPDRGHKGLRRPSLQKSGQRQQAAVFRPQEPFGVARAKGCMFVGGALSFPCRHAQHIGRFVPQEIRCDPGRALDCLRHHQHPGAALLVGVAQVLDAGDGTIRIEQDAKADLLG